MGLKTEQENQVEKQEKEVEKKTEIEREKGRELGGDFRFRTRTFSWEKNKENGDFSGAYRGGFWGAGVRAEEETNLRYGGEGSKILEIEH